MAIGTALLNARRRFIAAAWAPVLNNVVVITILLLGRRARLRRATTRCTEVVDDTGLLLVLGLGTTAGIVAMTLALLPAAAPGRRAHPVPARLAAPRGAQGARPVGLDHRLRHRQPGGGPDRQRAGRTRVGRRHQLQRRLHVLPAPARAAGRLAHDHVPARPGPCRGPPRLVAVQRAPAARPAAAVARRRAGGHRLPGPRALRRRGGRGERRARRRRHAADRPHPRRLRPRPHRLLDLPVRAARPSTRCRTPARRSSSTASRTRSTSSSRSSSCGPSASWAWPWPTRSPTRSRRCSPSSC